MSESRKIKSFYTLILTRVTQILLCLNVKIVLIMNTSIWMKINNRTEESKNLMVSKDAIDLLVPEITSRKNLVLENNLWLPAYVNSLLSENQNPRNPSWKIESLAEANIPLVIKTPIVEEVQWDFWNTIEEVLCKSIPIHNPTIDIESIKWASSNILNQFFNSPCYERALELPVLDLKPNGQAYYWKTKIWWEHQRYRFEFWEKTTQAEALRLSLDARAKFQEAQELHKILIWLEKDSIVEKTENWEFRIKGMFLKLSEHETLWIYVKQAWKSEFWKSIEHNERWFLIAFKKVLDELFKKNPWLTWDQKSALLSLNNETLYPNKSRATRVDESIIDQRILTAKEELSKAGLIEQTNIWGYRLKWVSINKDKKSIQINLKWQKVKKSFADKSFEKAYEIALKEFFLNYEKRNTLSICQKHVIDWLNTLDLYLEE